MLNGVPCSPPGFVIVLSSPPAQEMSWLNLTYTSVALMLSTPFVVGGATSNFILLRIPRPIRVGMMDLISTMYTTRFVSKNAPLPPVSPVGIMRQTLALVPEAVTVTVTLPVSLVLSRILSLWTTGTFVAPLNPLALHKASNATRRILISEWMPWPVNTKVVSCPFNALRGAMCSTLGVNASRRRPVSWYFGAPWIFKHTLALG